VVKTVRDELTAMLGKHASRCLRRGLPRMDVVGAGLGKTTTTASWRNGDAARHRPIVVSTDVYRPAAANSLRRWQKRLARRCGQGRQIANGDCARSDQGGQAFGERCDLVDTAGRLHIDDELMNELSTLKKELQRQRFFLSRTR